MATKEKTGIVVSNKMDKSVVVAVEYRYKHPIYSKIVIRTKRYMAHDASNTCNIGDKVTLLPHRPLSKKKRWIIKDIVAQSTIKI